MTIRDELTALQQRDGLLRPEAAVAWAREHNQSALHGALEWNDTIAAEAHRLQQVRQLIALHVVNEKGIRAMVSLTIDRTGAGGYRDIESVLATPDLREVLLADALAELERMRAKYESLVELAKVWDEIHRVQTAQRRRGRRKRGEEQATAHA